MDVSFAALRVDSTRLQARGAFCGGRRRLDGSFVGADVPRVAQAALHVQLIGAVVRHSQAYSHVERPPAAQPVEEAFDRRAS